MSSPPSSTPMQPQSPGRRNPKASRPVRHAQRRREEALERQQNAREDATARARKLAMEATAAQEQAAAPGKDAEMADGGAAAARRQASRNAGTSGEVHAAESVREHWARQLMRPEWLVDIPPNLASEWYVMPRPEGQRCLLVASGGQTVARMRIGVQMARFPSALPGGSRHTQSSSNSYCILDAIYHPPNQTYYVMDMMCWKGYALYDCSAEFRLFWVASKLAETDAAAAGSSYNRYAVVGVPAYNASPGGLASAHSAPAPFVRDGLYLLHKEGHYRLGQSPLALTWKGVGCTRYLLDTDLSGAPLAEQQVVLECQEDGALVTGDEEPVVLGRLQGSGTPDGAAAPSKLMRFTIGSGGLQLVDGHPVAADLRYEGGAHSRRGRADTTSKVLFQYLARRQPVTLEALAEAAAAGIQP